MPNRDSTGPQGLGPMTGRGMGPCGNGIARGCGRGLGRGFGRGPGFQGRVVLSKDEEKKILQANLETIESEKESIKKRLEELE